MGSDGGTGNGYGGVAVIAHRRSTAPGWAPTWNGESWERRRRRMWTTSEDGDDGGGGGKAVIRHDSGNLVVDSL